MKSFMVYRWYTSSCLCLGMYWIKNDSAWIHFFVHCTVYAQETPIYWLLMLFLIIIRCLLAFTGVFLIARTRPKIKMDSVLISMGKISGMWIEKLYLATVLLKCSAVTRYCVSQVRAALLTCSQRQRTISMEVWLPNLGATVECSRKTLRSPSNGLIGIVKCVCVRQRPLVW